MPLCFDPAAYHLEDFHDWMSVQTAMEIRLAEYSMEHDLGFASHHMRVAADSLTFLMFLGYPDHMCWNIKSALLIHDLGKTHDAYDPEIWKLPHRPSEEERAEKRLHTRRGVEILNEAIADKPAAFQDHPHLQLVRAVMLYHHERLNGSLYENVTDLPEWMQAICIIDTYDGDRIKRPHQDGRRSPEEAIQRMMAERGEKYEGAFDPDLMKKFKAYKL